MRHDKNHFVRKWGTLIADLFCILFSYVLALQIRFDGIDNASMSLGSQSGLFFGAVLIVLVLVFNFVYTKNRYLFSRSWILELKLIVYYNIYLMIGMVTVAFLIHRVPMLSRLATGYFVVIDIIVMMIIRQTLKYVITNIYKASSSSSSSIVLLSNEKLLDETVKRFDTGLTYKITGLLKVKDNKVVGNVDDLKIECSLEDLANEMVSVVCDNLVINLPNVNEDIIKEVIDEFEDMGANCYYVLNVPASFDEGTELTRFGDIPVATYTLNERSSWKLLLKRIFDICVAIVGLIFCFIIGIFVVPAIKLESKGPAIFSQIRIGKNGRRFKFYKFRSMYADAEERKKELEKQNQMDGLMFKIEDDPRITKVGKFIRKTSLDEFPQFWNVLIGDMSIIDTRPPTEDEFKLYNPHYKRRLSMKPGITGLWQVSGRSQITDFDEVVKLDLEYIDNWSLTLDIEIFFKTFAAVLKRKGAE